MAPEGDDMLEGGTGTADEHVGDGAAVAVVEHRDLQDEGAVNGQPLGKVGLAGPELG